MGFDQVYFKNCLLELLNIHSVSGMYHDIEQYIMGKLNNHKFVVEKLNKGGIIVDLGGQGNSVVVSAHADTIGLMVKNINEDGTITVTSIGRVPESAVENQNVFLYTLTDMRYTGTIRRKWSCVQVAPFSVREEAASYEDNLILVLDENVNCAGDIKKLGINCGDYIAIEPRTCITPNGYIKSYYLDNKINIALMLTYINSIKEGINNNSKVCNRKTYFYFSMHEEILHGGSIMLPVSVEEFLALDVCCVCNDQQSEEHNVSICISDSRFPCNRQLIKKLIDIAENNNINYKTDIFLPTYSSDADLTLLCGNDVRHALIGPGVMGTHNYERAHIDGVINTYRLIEEYLSF